MAMYLTSDGDGRICAKSCRCIVYDDDERFLTWWHKVFGTFAVRGQITCRVSTKLGKILTDTTQDASIVGDSFLCFPVQASYI